MIVTMHASTSHTLPSPVKMTDIGGIGVDPSQAKKAFIHGHAKGTVHNFLQFQVQMQVLLFHF